MPRASQYIPTFATVGVDLVENTRALFPGVFMSEDTLKRLARAQANLESLDENYRPGRNTTAAVAAHKQMTNLLGETVAENMPEATRDALLIRYPSTLQDALMIASSMDEDHKEERDQVPADRRILEALKASKAASSVTAWDFIKVIQQKISWDGQSVTLSDNVIVDNMADMVAANIAVLQHFEKLRLKSAQNAVKRTDLIIHSREDHERFLRFFNGTGVADRDAYFGNGSYGENGIQAARLETPRLRDEARLFPGFVKQRVDVTQGSGTKPSVERDQISWWCDEETGGLDLIVRVGESDYTRVFVRRVNWYEQRAEVAKTLKGSANAAGPGT
ncbi:hypothetical protein H2200_003677 [Cladophialophora chaetospira]|uniref:Uncharacterized protein n=1 Tax=Cladophialophora chaetospira TaxID=386627 RepID=A0AA39CKY9_9EURO|nr:hypothetical protein H2200_003677 [Cladophialophora chaetospira]